MTKQEAKDKLYSLWENGEIPSNFTEEHSLYERAVAQMMKKGYINWEDFF